MTTEDTDDMDHSAQPTFLEYFHFETRSNASQLEGAITVSQLRCFQQQSQPQCLYIHIEWPV